MIVNLLFIKNMNNMKSSKELKNIYESELKPKLASMEAERLTVKKWKYLTTLVVVLLFIVFSFFGSFFNPLFYYPIIIGLIASAIIFGFKYTTTYSVYKKRFKAQIVEKIIEFINPNYHYFSKRYIPSKDYINSGIFPTKMDRYTGDDLVEGIIDKTPFTFSEIKSEYKREGTDSKGNRTVEWYTIFKGLFFVAEFNKTLNKHTFVVPEKTKVSLFGKERKKVSSYGELVKLENPTFEKIFSVYGDSQQEARYVLTPTMMEAMVKMQQKYGKKMFFSFIDSKVYCAIPIKKDMFEPKVRKGIEYKDIEEMYLLFGLIETIINEMNLNTRIWTKD